MSLSLRLFSRVREEFHIERVNTFFKLFHNMNFRSLFILLLMVFSVLITPSLGLNVVSTTSVLWDPVMSIGGEKVDVIYIADPAVCPHMQGDIIPNRIQIEKDFISSADLFVAHNSSVDQQYVMSYMDKFMDANDFGDVNWVTLKDPNMTWNTPEKAKALAEEVYGWLIAADPENEDYYSGNYAEYSAEIDEAGLFTPEEAELIPGREVIPIIWQKDAVENWLSLDVVDIYAPDFYMGGKFSASKLVDRISADSGNYSEVAYVIENMQSGELAKGVEEKLKDNGIATKRVVFTNFPKSIDGVDSIPDVLKYNKGLVTPANGGSDVKEAVSGSSVSPESNIPEPTNAAPGFTFLTVLLSAGAVMIAGRHILK